MEDGLEKSTSGSEVQEGDDSINHEKNQTDGTRKQHCAESILKPSLSGLKTIGNCEEKEHKSTEAEMTKVIEENARLKKMLEQIEMEYQSLQVRFIDILQKEPRKSKNLSINHEDSEEPELVSLCLGRSTTDPKRDNTTSSSNKTRENEHEGLKLGLGYDFNGPKPNCPELPSNPSPENSLEEGTKEKKAGETCPPSTVLKTARSGEDEFSQQSNVKRARVSVRARCDTPTMNDGCQWRKYGQKIAKGNPCPRAYYRCTIAQACPVRKQVQRCAEDMSILITTYEGIHNHPLPVSATAMASTTSAAASMLMSGSSSSQQGIGLSTTSAPETNFLGLNFSLSDNPRTKPYYIPNSSASQAFPTITLDLTSRPNAHLNTYSSTRFPSTSFTFNSSESNILPTWANGYPSYGTPPYTRTNNGSISVGRPSQEQFYQPYTVKNDQALPQQYLTETLTKAITSDPSFRSVIAAAISTMVTGGGENQQNQRRETFGLTNSCASKAEIRDHIN